MTARLPTGKDEGDFLLLQSRFSEFHDERWLNLKLIRSGPRE